MKFNFLLVLLNLTTLSYAQQDTIVYDPTTGNYIITYLGYEYDTDKRIKVREIFEPSTKIDPYISSNAIGIDKENTYQYEYSIANGSIGKQRLQNFDLEVLSLINNTKSPDKYWETGRFSYIPVFGWYNFKDESGMPHPYDGIAPDSSVSGFSFISKGLPSIVTSFFTGKTSIFCHFLMSLLEKLKIY